MVLKGTMERSEHSGVRPGAWRYEVLHRLEEELPGRNLYELAARYGVPVHKQGKLNKGWVGQTIERVAGLDAGAAQRRDGNDFELKSTSLVKGAEVWQPKETIKITAMGPRAILEESFESSALWNKLSRWILVGVTHRQDLPVCQVVQVRAFDVTAPDLVAEIQAFWEEVRSLVAAGEIADYNSQGSSGGYLQLRPTGNRHNNHVCPVTQRRYQAQAFYATKRLVKRVLCLSE
jgi:DNA mismatch repair protein MutH